MLIVDSNIQIRISEFDFRFARSPGPGGQNVNKVNSKVTLRWAIETSSALPDTVKSRFLKQNPRRISKDGYFAISSHRYRDQGRNISDCLDKLKQLILDVVPEPVQRKTKKVSRAAKKKRLDEKRRQSDKKQSRSNRFGD